MSRQIRTEIDRNRDHTETIKNLRRLNEVASITSGQVLTGVTSRLDHSAQEIRDLRTEVTCLSRNNSIQSAEIKGMKAKLLTQDQAIAEMMVSITNLQTRIGL